MGMHILDERSLHKGFMPNWHRMMTCAGWESDDHCKTRTVRILTLCIIWFVTEHQIIGVFFLLPWANATRAQALLIAINSQLAATNMIFLFWSTFTAFSGDDWMDEPPSATHALWSYMFHTFAVNVLTVVCAMIFGWANTPALAPERDFFASLDEDNEQQRKLERAIAAAKGEKASDRVNGALRLRRHLHGQQSLKRLVEERSGWYIVFRQTAPDAWPRNADPLTVNPWNLQAEQFATLDERTSACTDLRSSRMHGH